MKIAFAILSYDQPEQLLRLVKTLNKMFDSPPIGCHHNFDQCLLDETIFPANVDFIRPHINTRWGHITTPLAALKIFSFLAKKYQPDWFVLLSGSDYPVRKAEEIIEDLSRTDFDAFLDSRNIESEAPPPGQTAEHGFARPGWIEIAHSRYSGYRYWLPYPSGVKLFSGSIPFRKRFFSIKEGQMRKVLDLVGISRPAQIHGGEFWFHANQKAISRLLSPALQPFWRYYRNIEIPEESAFHSALCNMKDLRICNDHRRYSNWENGGEHPKWLDVADVPRIIASGAYFARKFLPDGRTQDLIDETVLHLR
jgi:Core-2/I-Branching enzyme